MLVLGRKVNDRVIITTPQGQRIVVTVVEVRKSSQGGIRLGFEAPEDVAITRDDCKSARPERSENQTVWGRF